MADHAERILQPSGFKRTKHCAGWGKQSEGIPPQETSEFAALGTVTHELNGLCLEKNVSPETFRGKTGWHNTGTNGRSRTGIGNSDIAPLEKKGKHFVFTVDDDMINASSIYVDYINSLRAKVVNGVEFIEKRMNMSWIAKGMFGTGDHILLEPLRIGYVTDYKHGAGVVVEIGENVGDNEQTSLYALGALGADNPHGVEVIQAAIVQPRAPHPDGSIRSVEYPVKQLYEWADDVVRPAIALARSEDPPLKAGPWCKWCPANNPATCPAIKSALKNRAASMFAPVDLGPDNLPAVGVNAPDATRLSGEQIDRFLEFRGVFKDMLEQIEMEARRRLEANAPDAPKLFKLVQGKLSNRAWKVDGEALKDRFGVFVDVFCQTLKSPAQLEKELKSAGMKGKDIAKQFEELLAERQYGTPTLTSVDDKRPAITVVEELLGPDNEGEI